MVVTAQLRRGHRPKREAPLILAALGLFFIGAGCGHPSDKSLASNFYRNQAAFARLVQMAATDSGVVRIAPDYTCCPKVYASQPEPQQGRPGEARLSDSRWEEYRTIFRQLGLEEGISNLGSGGFAFLASSVGIVNRGSLKGYIYSAVPLTPILNSLDGRSPGPCSVKRDCDVYKHLTGNWYLFFEQ
jgi:hypothetical protein